MVTKNLKFIGLLWPAMALSACTTGQDALNVMTPKYIGKKADVFFSENGPPSSQYLLENGSRIYRWTTGETKMDLPEATAFNATTYGNSINGTATNLGGGSVAVV